MLGATVDARPADDTLQKMDSIEIGLITCTPHEEVYSLYGHTAIRYRDLSTGQDLAFNYGVFNLKAPTLCYALYWVRPITNWVLFL
jgi:hypothetical protein